jgi:hypothetical protein
MISKRIWPATKRACLPVILQDPSRTMEINMGKSTVRLPLPVEDVAEAGG